MPKSATPRQPLVAPAATTAKRERTPRVPSRPPAAAAAVEPSAASADPIRARPGDPDFMTSLARGLTVIGAFTRQKRQLTIAQISQRTGIPRAAVRRCLYTLGRLGYVGSDDRRTFALRPKILELGHAYMTSSPLASSSQPILDRVSDVIHESCSMAILDGDEILYIARSSTHDRIISIDLGLGSRLPAHCTSMGRVLLAGLVAPELEAFLARVRMIAYTNRTITSPQKLADAIAKVRRDGYALVDQELEIGLRSLAVPVQDRSGRVAAAVNVGVQASRVTAADLQSRILPELLTAGRELGMLLSV
jgi:IclR family pca regulon transcriptional regulator